MLHTCFSVSRSGTWMSGVTTKVCGDCTWRAMKCWLLECRTQNMREYEYVGYCKVIVRWNHNYSRHIYVWFIFQLSHTLVCKLWFEAFKYQMLRWDDAGREVLLNTCRQMSGEWLRGQPTNQPTKVLTRGGDVHQTQVDIPWSVWPFLHVITLLATLTDT